MTSGIRDHLLLTDRVAKLDELAATGELTTDDVIDVLSALPEETTVEFQVNIANLVGKVPDTVPFLREILSSDAEALQSLPEEADPDRVRFAAFNALATHHRRNQNLEKLEELHDDHRSRFADSIAYQVVQSVLLRIRAEQIDDRTILRQAIELQEHVLDEVRDNPAYYQAHANTIAQAIEDDVFTGEERERLLTQGMDAIEDAIDLWDEYGKYHVTKGRLHALRGEYGAAREEIRTGIDLEDESKEDYALRIGQFRQHLLRIDLRETRDEIQTDIDTFRDELDDRFEDARAEITELRDESEAIVQRFRNTTLQFLGFFTAIIAAVVTTIQIAAQYPPQQAAGLIIVVFGGLTASFGSFSLIIPDDTATRHGIGIVVLGLGVVVSATLFVFLAA